MTKINPKLLVSGIVYTPLGDKGGFDKPLTYDKIIKNQSYPLPLKPYYDNIKVGQVLSIQKEFYNNIPVFYVLGLVHHPKSISRILRSSINRQSKERSLHFQIHVILGVLILIIMK